MSTRFGIKRPFIFSGGFTDAGEKIAGSLKHSLHKNERISGSVENFFFKKTRALTSRHFVSLRGTERSVLSRYYLYRKSLHFFVQVMQHYRKLGMPERQGRMHNCREPQRASR